MPCGCILKAQKSLQVYFLNMRIQIDLADARYMRAHAVIINILVCDIVVTYANIVVH